MKNIFGTQEELKLYHKNGELAYTLTRVYFYKSIEAIGYCNVFRTQKDLKLYHKNGKLAYTFYKNSVGYLLTHIYNEEGSLTSSVTSNDDAGVSWLKTYDNRGRITFYEDSDGVSWKRIYNKNGTCEQINL